MLQKATNITWHKGKVTGEDREKRNGHKGVVIWFTGLSGSGKSTVAVEVEHALFDMGAHVYMLDGDNVRHGLNKNLGFSAEDRTENIRRIGEVARLFADSGALALTSFISPYRKDRDAARALMGEGEFIEVYVKADIETCKQRDPKGLYKKALAGEIKEFTGISAPYEEPENAELVVDTSKLSIEESSQAVVDFLIDRGIVGQPV
jgi:adenylyl-sulfate kinase